MYSSKTKALSLEVHYFSHLHHYNTNKLQFRSKQCIFLGYSLNHLDICVWILTMVVCIYCIMLSEMTHPSKNCEATSQLLLALAPPVSIPPVVTIAHTQTAIVPSNPMPSSPSLHLLISYTLLNPNSL